MVPLFWFATAKHRLVCKWSLTNVAALDPSLNIADTNHVRKN